MKKHRKHMKPIVKAAAPAKSVLVAKKPNGIRSQAEYRAWLVCEIAKLDAAVAKSQDQPGEQASMRQESAAKTKELAAL